ncbi:hypothetical protein OAW32_02575 [bacterium]|nr:hypothetical protein [bacterium]
MSSLLARLSVVVVVGLFPSLYLMLALLEVAVAVALAVVAAAEAAT